MHELALHWTGELDERYFISSIEFEQYVNKEDVSSILQKYKVDTLVYVDETHTKVRRLIFKRCREEQNEIEKMYEEFKVKGLKMRAAHVKEYFPVEFELDDVKILDEDLN
jgi:hypothetical protein